MKASPTTSKGLIIHNSTHYNTFDLLALINAFEAGMRKYQRIVQISPIATVDNQVSLRDYCGTRTTERVYLTGRIEDQPVYVVPGHGANRGVLKLRKAGKMFDNPVEQLVWETQENKTVPVAFLEQFLEKLAPAYNLDRRDAAKTIKGLDLTQYPVRVLKNRATPATKSAGTSRQRKSARSALTSMHFRLAQAASAVGNVITHFSPTDINGEENHLYRDVMAVRGEFPELERLHGIVSEINQLVEKAKESAASIVAPEFEKKESAE